MVWCVVIGVFYDVIVGMNFVSKKLLCFGIILFGMWLNFVDIVKVGLKVLVIVVVVIIFIIFVVYGLMKVFKVEKKFGILIVCGMVICGVVVVVVIVL